MLTTFANLLLLYSFSLFAMNIPFYLNPTSPKLIAVVFLPPPGLNDRINTKCEEIEKSNEEVVHV